MVGAVLAVSVFSACDADESGDAAGASTEPTTGDEATVAPRASVPAPTSGQRCSGANTTAAAGAVADDATVTLGPINGVKATTADGVPLVVVGTVYAQDCEPLAGARLSMWQTDGAGDYGPGHGSDDMRCCYLGGDVETDAAGRFQLITVRPGHYRGEPNPPPAHIHLEVRHSDAPQLDTEIVFADDDRVPPNAESLGLIVTHPIRDGDGWRANAEIVMGGSRG